jgi:hypothetical protein
VSLCCCHLHIPTAGDARRSIGAGPRPAALMDEHGRFELPGSVQLYSLLCCHSRQGRDDEWWSHAFLIQNVVLRRPHYSQSHLPKRVVLAVMHAPVECGASARGSAGKKPAHRPDGQAERGGGGRRSVRTDTERRRALAACRGRSRGGRSGRYLYLTERAPRPVAIGAPACVAARPAPGATPKLTSRARPRIPDVHFVSRHEGKLDRARTENHHHTGGSNQRREKGSSYGAQSQSAST